MLFDAARASLRTLAAVRRPDQIRISNGGLLLEPEQRAET
jgi:hypothetical protein